MLRKKGWVGLVVLGLSVQAVTAAPAVAAPSGSGVGGPAAGWRGPNSPIGRMLSGNVGRLLALRADLNVTDAQREQIRGILSEHRQEIVSTLRTVRTQRLALRDAVLANSPEESKIRAQASQLGQAIAEAAVKASRLRGQIGPILTPEQRGRIGQFRAECDVSIERLLEAAGQGPILKP